MIYGYSRMRTLKRTIEDLANDFALSVIGVLRSSSIEELTGLAGISPRGGAAGRASASEGGAPRRPPAGRLGRRTKGDIDRMVDEIVALLQNAPEGLRSEQLREQLGCEAKELPRPLSEALSRGLVSKSGQKRATTYFAGGKTESAAEKRRGRVIRRKRAAS